MISVDKKVKAWVFVSLCSLLVWIIRLVPDSISRFYNIVFVSWNYYYRAVVGGWMYTLAAVGIAARLIAVIIGIASLLLIWNNNTSFIRIRRWVAAAVSLESLYYALLIPSPIWLFALAGESRISYTFGISYVLQIVFTVPFLAVLAFKLFKHGKNPVDFPLLKWAGIAFSGYVVALWANSVLRWVDMISAAGFVFFLAGISPVGALNALVFMSLAVAFAVVGAVSVVKQKES